VLKISGKHLTTGQRATAGRFAFGGVVAIGGKSLLKRVCLYLLLVARRSSGHPIGQAATDENWFGGGCWDYTFDKYEGGGIT
jgi:hypothetical protein